MQEQEENIEIIVKPEIDLKRKAQVMYFGGYKISEISRQLDIPVSTISSWKERDKWDDIAPVGRVELALESRMILLIAKEQKSGADFKEIDLLGRQMEKVARVKKYSFGEGNETDLNPKIKNRNSGPRKTGDKNPISEEQQELLINGFLEGMFNYQRLWFDAGKQHRIRNILKSRQIGATYYFAHEALVDALVTGRNQISLQVKNKRCSFAHTLPLMREKRLMLNLKAKQSYYRTVQN